MSELSDRDILNFVLQNGIIDINTIPMQIEMKKRQDIISKHPYKIYEGADGKWHTYLPDEKKGRVAKKRNTKKEIEDLVIDFYKKQDEKPKTFDDAYWKWRSVQDTGVSDNTIAKYETDYKRFFYETDFANTPISDLNSENIKVHVNLRIKNLKLCKTACKSLVWYMKSVFNSARINHWISEDPMRDMAAKNFYGLCVEKDRPMDKVLVSKEEMHMLNERFKKDYENKSSYIVTYAVEFASYTGMRVGEISALRWDCVKKDRIIIDKSEKYNRITKEYFIDKTKNKNNREFPITDEIRDLLDRVKKVEIQNGFICEWVFANADGRIHAPAISSCAGNKCLQLGITEKGIHAYRRTINSKMRQCGVPVKTAASLLGHTEDVNEKYYTYDISTFDEKEAIVAKINRQTNCS